MMIDHSILNNVMDHIPSTCMHSLQEQRKTLPINGAIYAAIKKVILILLLKFNLIHEFIDLQAQQYESGPVPELFEEEETYWEPAVDTPGLIRQLSSKKYREILRPRLQYERESASVFSKI